MEYQPQLPHTLISAHRRRQSHSHLNSFLTKTTTATLTIDSPLARHQTCTSSPSNPYFFVMLASQGHNFPTTRHTVCFIISHLGLLYHVHHHSPSQLGVRSPNSGGHLYYYLHRRIIPRLPKNGKRSRHRLLAYRFSSILAFVRVRSRLLLGGMVLCMSFIFEEVWQWEADLHLISR